MYTVYTNIISIFGINPECGVAVVLQVAVCEMSLCCTVKMRQ